jgi:glycosyltransferase involved in cell wall biosynthesis
MSPLISVIIPVYNASSSLPQCLEAVNRSEYRDFECLVADDGSSDASRELAAKSGARILSTGNRRGPACARNLAAATARGDILLFIDADVCIETNTMAKIAKAFAEDAALDALMGSYDDDPAEPNFVSQYKNLMHCFFHQQAKLRASTFWTGCGAIRRRVFLASGGFNEHYSRPCIEDIELGSRMIRASSKIELEPSLTVKHLKHWTFLGLLKTDIRDRAIPWTLLMIRERQIPNDLNTQWSQRLSIALTYIALLLAIPHWPASMVVVALVVAINQRFYRFLVRRRGLFFGVLASPYHLLYFLYSGAAFAAACCIWACREYLQKFSYSNIHPPVSRCPAIGFGLVDDAEPASRDSSANPHVSVLRNEITEKAPG